MTSLPPKAQGSSSAEGDPVRAPDAAPARRAVLAPAQITVRTVQLRGLLAAGHLWPDEFELLLEWYAGQLPVALEGEGADEEDDA